MQCDYVLSNSVGMILDLHFKVLTAIVMAEKNSARFLMQISYNRHKQISAKI